VSTAFLLRLPAFVLLCNRSVAFEFAVAARGAAEEGEQHLETFHGLDFMGEASGHQNDLSCRDADRVTAEDDFGLAIEDLYESMERDGVLGESLAGIKAEHCEGSGFVLQQGATDNCAILIGCHFAQGVCLARIYMNLSGLARHSVPPIMFSCWS
jgi:hypothetical protein